MKLQGLYEIIKEEDLKSELKKISDEYTNLKSRAYARYYDPIDFPQDVKNKLQQLSAKKASLKRQIDPAKSAAQDALAYKKRMEKRKIKK
jgi:hypothetical protein